MSAALKIINHILSAFQPVNKAYTIREQLVNLRVDCDNCELRFIRKSDAQQLVKAANSKHVAKYLRDRFPHPYTLDCAQWWIEHNQTLLQQYIKVSTDIQGTEKQYFALESFIFQIVDKTTDLVIGGIGLERDRHEFHKAELGYWLDEKYWNRGIATNAVRGFMHFIWNNNVRKNGSIANRLTLSNLIRIEAFIADQNIYSAKVVEKCGFKQEGFHRKAHKYRNGTIGNTYSFAIIKTDICDDNV
eukprot:723991_1